MLIFSATLRPHAFSPLSPLLPKLPIRPQHPPLLSLRSIPKHHPRRLLLLLLSFASKERESCLELEVAEHIIGRGERWGERETMMNVGERRRSKEEDKGETYLYSFAPYPLLLAAALPGASTVRSIFGPFVELVKAWNLPEWLVHWGHPGNMAVVLFAMGGYGSYLGFRIKLATDVEEKAMAKDLHPKLLGGMFFFFALGATGGITALLTADKPILESPHAVTGLIGLSLLTVQTILPFLFEGNPGLRTVHGLLGSGIMILFLIHAALGLQLGLSF